MGPVRYVERIERRHSVREPVRPFERVLGSGGVGPVRYAERAQDSWGVGSAGAPGFRGGVSAQGAPTPGLPGWGYVSRPAAAGRGARAVGALFLRGRGPRPAGAARRGSGCGSGRGEPLSPR
ncbi:hypothetical protein GCM10026982_28880 [Nocardiopsis aegyptia]